MYFILLALTLLVGYIAVLVYEARRGTRFLEVRRARLDDMAGKAAFIVRHVDFASFAREELTRLARKAGHDLAHLTLVSVRALERLLTQLVRRLRMHAERAELPARESTRHFVRTLSEFKGHLETTRPEMPEVL